MPTHGELEKFELPRSSQLSASANSWYDQGTRLKVGAVDDPSSPVFQLGPKKPLPDRSDQGASGRRLGVDGISETLRAAGTRLAREPTANPRRAVAEPVDGEGDGRSPARYLWAMLIARLYEAFPFSQYPIYY